MNERLEIWEEAYRNMKKCYLAFYEEALYYISRKTIVLV